MPEMLAKNFILAVIATGWRLDDGNRPPVVLFENVESEVGVESSNATEIAVSTPVGMQAVTARLTER